MPAPAPTDSRAPRFARLIVVAMLTMIVIPAAITLHQFASPLRRFLSTKARRRMATPLAFCCSSFPSHLSRFGSSQ